MRVAAITVPFFGGRSPFGYLKVTSQGGSLKGRPLSFFISFDSESLEISPWISVPGPRVSRSEVEALRNQFVVVLYDPVSVLYIKTGSFGWQNRSIISGVFGRS